MISDSLCKFEVWTRTLEGYLGLVVLSDDVLRSVSEQVGGVVPEQVAPHVQLIPQVQSPSLCL